MTDKRNIPPKANSYTEADIKVIEAMQLVRLRPGMYVGGKDIRALHHLIYEVVDNSIDEALAGRCDRILVVLHDDGSVSVTDNGGGIPVGLHKETGKSALEVVMTTLGGGAKFGGGAYKVSGGLHGVGVSAVNALSIELIAEVFRDGYLWRQVYRTGVPQTRVDRIRPLERDESTGTRVRFVPDFTVLEHNEFNFTTLATRFREMAFVTRKVTITLRDERVKPIPRETTFYFEGGLHSFVRYLNRNRQALHEPVYCEREVEVPLNGQPPVTIGVEIAFQYTDSATVAELAFANTIGTPDGGSHQTGMRSAITSVINRYARKANLLKEKEANFSGNDTMEGLTAIVSIKHPAPQFESQTKVKLLNPEAQGAVSQVVSEAFQEFLELNPRDARHIVEKCMTSKRAREAAKKARDLVRSGPSLLESSTLPGKLADCSLHGDDSEIYIVEGDSAGGCFSGDTRIALGDGRNLSFAELVAEQAKGQEHLCYTMRYDGTVGLERILNARITRRNTKVIRVTLDNQETLVCTPDHRFLLRNGSYKIAIDLIPMDSLMPFAHESIAINEFAGIHTGIRHDQRILRADQSRWTGIVKQMAWGEKTPVAIHGYDQHTVSVVSIEPIADRINVYDIEVPHTHNFALASGVFVHNSAKQGRDRHFQAVLPLRGKILNTERARLDKILDNNEIKALISALGAGIHEDFQLDKLRYGRVILMTDADADGLHIRTLLLTFFFRHMPLLIQDSHLYIAQPPIYLLRHGRDSQYIYNEPGVNETALLEKALKNFKSPDRVHVQRYKGLGEMNPEQLWETTMDPQARTLLQVTIEDAAEADRIFDILMGNSVLPRRRFIQTHAKQVRNLDI